ncbi:unnamed protein product [Caenorhabditis nigoni]
MPSFDMVTLLQRFYAPPFGRILLDGKPIENMDHKFYHTKIVIFCMDVMKNRGRLIYEGYVAELENHKELMKDTDGMN